jgi:hypothetical protein
MNDELNALAAVKDPTSYSWITYLWVGVLSLWGGTVRFVNQIRSDKTIKSAFVSWLAGGCTSIFVGLLTFYICEATNTDQLWTAVFVALAGHMGAEGLRLMQDGAAARFKAVFAALTGRTPSNPEQ